MEAQVFRQVLPHPQMLGGVAVADPRHAAELTLIERAPNGVESMPAMLARLLSAHETVIEAVRAAIVKTAQTGDSGTNDLLVSQILRTHEQQIWFIAEHAVATPRSTPASTTPHKDYTSEHHIGFIVGQTSEQIEAEIAQLRGTGQDMPIVDTPHHDPSINAQTNEMIARNDVLPS